MNEIGLTILRNYGLAAFLMVILTAFCGWMLHKVISYFMKSIESKDNHIVDITSKFTESFDKNSHALSENSRALAESTAMTKMVLDHIQRV